MTEAFPLQWPSGIPRARYRVNSAFSQPNEVREHPILMSAPMMRASMQGIKTETRRVIKPQPERVWGYGVDRDGEYRAHVRYPGGQQPDPYIYCQYGRPGDLLWFKEDVSFAQGSQSRIQVTYMADGASAYVDAVEFAQYERGCIAKGSRGLGSHGALYMPRFACRATPEIRTIYIERLQDISNCDAVAEGIQVGEIAKALGVPFASLPDQRSAYAALWNSLHSTPKPFRVRNAAGRMVIDHYVTHPWEDVQEIRTYRGKPWRVQGNPFVWVVGFWRIT